MTMKNDEESFSELLEKAKWFIESLPVRDDLEKEKLYILDFKSLLEEHQRKDFLYYYPNELKGFIQSCILASQRELSNDIRDVCIFKELDNAYIHYKGMEELHANIRGLELQEDKNKWYSDMTDAIDIDIVVQKTMANIREAHGDYAIIEDSFQWTKANALVVKLRF